MKRAVDAREVCAAHLPFTRVTNAFSKKLANHEHMLAISSSYCNFARVHQILRVTPAMETRLGDYVWALDEIAGLVS